jgi:SIR2-like domain
MSESGPTVWILGAGFSRSLGGLLLPELLSAKSKAETLERFQDIKGDLERVYRVFWKHYRGDETNQGTRNGGPVYWEHAEQFLDFVDTATKGNVARRAILTAALETPDLFEGFHEKCVRVIAAECAITSSLVDLSDDASTPEAWQPYIRWAGNVRQHDSIITFNYDTVLETLGHGRTGCNFSSRTVFGTKPAVAKGAQIYKLHGSVDWRTPTAGGSIEVADVGELLKQPGQPFIATPGPSKKLHCTGRLKVIWDSAMAALKAAEQVVFVGYRFPPSDSESRTQLLGALRDNATGKGVRVHTVLGPRSSDDDTVRLRELLRSALSEKHQAWPLDSDVVPVGCFQVFVHPLYAEDFFSVFRPRLLYGR